MKQEQMELYPLSASDISTVRAILSDWSNDEWNPIKLWGKDGELTAGFGDTENWYRAIVYKMKSGYHIDIVDNLHGKLIEITQ